VAAGRIKNSLGQRIIRADGTRGVGEPGSKCCCNEEDPCVASFPGTDPPPGPYPSTLTLDDYATGLFTTSPPDCECDEIATEWDGVLDLDDPVAGEYYANGSNPTQFFYHIKCAGGEVYNFADQPGAHLYWDGSTKGNTGTWRLELNGCDDLWIGKKLPGSGPAGRYRRCEGCSLTPEFIDLI
jgi:hypothetical protein